MRLFFALEIRLLSCGQILVDLFFDCLGKGYLVWLFFCPLIALIEIKKATSVLAEVAF
jgi:hypothetical protein